MVRFSAHIKPWVILVPALLWLSACSKIAVKQDDLNQALYTGNLQEAYDILSEDSSKWLKKRNALLYYWNKGTVAWLMGKPEESSRLFMTSDYFLEDIYTNYANIAASLMINNKVLQYTGEDHERILFHYYQIINFMQLGNREYALVQARRLLLELSRLNDRYKDQGLLKNKRYQEDAFAYLLVGLVFEANGDEENAYVAYKNAVRIYTEDYQKYYQIQVPEQLQSDILRLAYKLGNGADLQYYEELFGVRYNPATHAGGNLVFFWNNGMSPVKVERSINFLVIRQGNTGWVTFVNYDYGYSFPVYLGKSHTHDTSAFSQVEFIRVTFPEYVSRGGWYQSAVLESSNAMKPVQLAEDISGIAHKVLNDRFLEEITRTLTRLALKKAAEYEARKKDPNAGAALGVVNFITEQADTRSWESLPHQIGYTRLQVPAGLQHVKLNVRQGNTVQEFPFTFQVPGYGMVFHAFHTLQPAIIPR